MEYYLKYFYYFPTSMSGGVTLKIMLLGFFFKGKGKVGPIKI